MPIVGLALNDKLDGFDSVPVRASNLEHTPTHRKTEAANPRRLSKGMLRSGGLDHFEVAGKAV